MRLIGSKVAAIAGSCHRATFMAARKESTVMSARLAIS
jgi:hypothetical protein